MAIPRALTTEGSSSSPPARSESVDASNPLRSTDPSGHCVWDACILEIGIAVALIVAIMVTAADSGGRHAAANPIPWCRYMNCLGDGSSPQQNAQFNSDTNGQTADPGGLDPDDPDLSKQGDAQERSVRSMLAREYQQTYGETDAAIRANLGIRGKVADFVGYNSRTGRWLIAESKGGNIDAAFDQLVNTMQGLQAKNAASIGNIDLQLYIRSGQFAKLTSGRIGGWRLDSSGLLGWYDEAGAWQYAEINGARIAVFRASN